VEVFKDSEEGVDKGGRHMTGKLELQGKDPKDIIPVNVKQYWRDRNHCKSREGRLIYIAKVLDLNEERYKVKSSLSDSDKEIGNEPPLGKRGEPPKGLLTALDDVMHHGLNRHFFFGRHRELSCHLVWSWYVLVDDKTDCSSYAVAHMVPDADHLNRISKEEEKTEDEHADL
jgi:hypothetical protein